MPCTKESPTLMCLSMLPSLCDIWYQFVSLGILRRQRVKCVPGTSSVVRMGVGFLDVISLVAPNVLLGTAWHIQNDSWYLQGVTKPGMWTRWDFQKGEIHLLKDKIWRLWLFMRIISFSYWNEGESVSSIINSSADYISFTLFVHALVTWKHYQV